MLHVSASIAATLERIKTVVIVLPCDLSVAELQEHAEIGAHLTACGNHANWNCNHGDPGYFESHPITVRQGVTNLIALRCDDVTSSLSSLSQLLQVSLRALSHELIRVFALHYIGCEERGEFIEGNAVLDSSQLKPRSLKVLGLSCRHFLN
jgi:hypothetical protein